ncbi:Uncharacterised protein [Mycobacteroides abscessus subsp. abscessus]|nr:Uncharacterised protein [Mycobacteroides abscessus subsp. abscessus]
MGPGTGTFLIITLTVAAGMTFLESSATAKVLNSGTNVGALIVFASQGHVLWLLALSSVRIWRSGAARVSSAWCCWWSSW